MVQALVAVLPAGARVLDVAAGRGRQTQALVGAGHHVTAVDVSAVGLSRLAEHVQGTVSVVVADLTQPLPPSLAGPYDAIVCVDYCDPALWSRLRERLSAGGQLLVSVATVRNLERNARPSRRFLVDPAAAPLIIGDLRCEQATAAWRESGRHELWARGRRV